jgi:hypothetical protein
LGAVAIDFGLKAILTAELMAKVAAFLTANPLLAIGAGIALVAAGRAMGGQSGATRTGGGFGGSGYSGSAPTPLSLSRLIVDPNAGVRQRIGSSLGNLATVTGPAPGQVINVIGYKTPLGSSMIGEANSRYIGKGGR